MRIGDVCFLFSACSLAVSLIPRRLGCDMGLTLPESSKARNDNRKGHSWQGVGYEKQDLVEVAVVDLTLQASYEMNF